MPNSQEVRQTCACGCGRTVEPIYRLYATAACRDKVVTEWDAWVASGVVLRPFRVQHSLGTRP